MDKEIDRLWMSHEALRKAERDNAYLTTLIGFLLDPDPCRFDHKGGCQAHGYLELEKDEECPQAEARRAVAQRRRPHRRDPDVYLVSWEIEVEASSAQGAAEEAFEIMQRDGTTATVFLVTAPDNSVTLHDLSEGK